MEISNLDQKMLKPFEDMLRCRICSEFFNYCVMTACSHNFCSLCLRKQMETDSDCCICYEEILESELRNNRSMDKIVRIYKKLMKTNTAQPQLHPPNNCKMNSHMFSSSVTQPVSDAQNYLPVQNSSTETVPMQITSPIHNIQPQGQSSTSYTAISSSEMVPVPNTSSTQNLQSAVTFPVVLLQRLQSAVLPKANAAKESSIYDDFDELADCSFTDDSNDSED